jgi:rSAM/selenodomain-associated transferase 2
LFYTILFYEITLYWLDGNLKNNPNQSNQPIISIIVPVFKEVNVINSFISSLADLQSTVHYEIIVVDGNEKCDTIKSVSKNDVITISSAYGRGQQLNAGAAVARGNILLFLHVDTKLQSFALNEICSVLKNENVGAGAFDIDIDSKKWRYKLLARMISIRARIRRNPFGDQAHFFRKDYFIKIGGYQNIVLMEDLEIMRRMRKRGDRIIILKIRVKTSPRRWEDEGIIRCIFRNWFIRSRYYLGEHPNRLVKYYNK